MATARIAKKAVSRWRVLSGLGLLGFVAGGCAQIIGADWGSYEGDGETGTGTQGGGGAGCVDPLTDCPSPETGCVVAACESGVCVEKNAPEGTLLESQPADCHSVECDGNGSSVPVVLAEQTKCTENGGAVCNGAGECVECVDGGNCDSGNCDGSMCVGTCGTDDVEAVPLSCQIGGPLTPGAGDTCGPNNDTNCCDNKLVPCGTYKRSYDNAMHTDDTHPATVSDFRLDTYEITVGRFRAFVNAGKGTQASPPVAGDGIYAKVKGSGWKEAWNASLEVDTAALKAALHCSGTYATWTDAVGSQEKLPINCIRWYEAFAFCAWDGGRLPTEAEWNYAAAGGMEQRAYPWSSGMIDDTYAVYACTGDGSAVGDCASTDIQPVGSRSPKGDGLWGQSDLAGNMWEWMLDSYGDYIFPCNDCAQLNAPYRVIRGGGFSYNASTLLSAVRNVNDPADRDSYVGARCARTQ